MTLVDYAFVFRGSLNRCLAQATFMRSFYERFLGSSDEVREKFAGVDMERQFQMVTDSLYVLAVVAEGGHGPEALASVAERHSRRGADVRAELYDLWLAALVTTVAGFDPEFGPEVEDAWRQTLAPGIAYMQSRY